MTGEVATAMAMAMATEEDTLSPKSRLKFPCSYGGKILPRPGDGQLKYVGGNTRLLVVPRSVTFADLHARAAPHDAAAVIKYQLMPDDLDILISVRNEDDVLHMVDEYDRHASPTSAASRFRLYLFSAASPPLAVSRGTSPPTSAVGGSGMQRVRSSPNLGESRRGLAPGSPRYLLRHPPLHKYTAAFGGGPWRAQAQLMSGGPRYEVCGCGRAVSVQQAQQMEKMCYYYPTPTPHVGPSALNRGSPR